MKRSRHFIMCTLVGIVTVCCFHTFLSTTLLESSLRFKQEIISAVMPKEASLTNDSVTYRNIPKALRTCRRRSKPSLKCRDIPKTSGTYLNTSRTNPQFYPFGGTGQTCNISDDFNFEIMNSFCKGKPNLQAIIPVYSAAANADVRKAIRETVGSECLIYNCKIIFIVGVTLDMSIYDKVTKEYEDTKDILIIDKLDTYKDLNNKAVAMFDWLIQYCKNAKYVIHTIDDTYPNIQYFLQQLNSILDGKYLLGPISIGAKPFRNPKIKWMLTEEEYPYKKFPPYIVGVIYAFRNRDTKLLRAAIHSVEYCWLEDIWVTGYVSKGAGFRLIGLDRSYPNHIPEIDKNLWLTYACIHGVNIEGYYTIFNEMTHSHLRPS